MSSLGPLSYEGFRIESWHMQRPVSPCCNPFFGPHTKIKIKIKIYSRKKLEK